MKKLCILCIVVSGAISAWAQPSVKQSARIKIEQVPVAVLQACQKDFGELPADGYWTVFAETIKEGSRTTGKPLWYSYHKRDRSGKVEVRYLPTGELEFSKGIMKIVNTAPVADSVLQQKKKIG